ncbi:MAG: nicotinate (nicotinamide) nucleotide adenylyltransferase [Simkaniaceae bacterium]|nr:nicotinate (nicotinamide) nucleotide adenylyltransferase [Simkaniaceae bacterium]
MGKIGFFGGSYDPIHNGHLNAAINILETQHFDKILLSPNFESPFRKKMADPIHRLTMVKLACSKFDGLDVCDIEIKRGGVSYTIDTLNELQRYYPQDEIQLIISDDLIADFPQWKDYEVIIKQFHPILASRLDVKPPPMPGFVVVKTPIVQISSTEIRLRLKEGLPCYHLLPEAVDEYITAHRLYR